MSEAARRRAKKWLLGLAAVAVLVFVLWIDSRFKWIAERDQMRTWIWGHAGSMEDAEANPPNPRAAPWSIRIWGEGGVTSITIDERKLIKSVREGPEREVAVIAKNLGRVFPEATIRFHDRNGNDSVAREPK